MREFKDFIEKLTDTFDEVANLVTSYGYLTSNTDIKYAVFDEDDGMIVKTVSKGSYFFRILNIMGFECWQILRTTDFVSFEWEDLPFRECKDKLIVYPYEIYI